MDTKKKLTSGCDNISRIYEDMFNVLQEVMQDEDKLKNLSSLDYSALGMYIGKFVEQEINSSVVQIMRAFQGIKMPQFYCKRYPRYVNPVVTDKRQISLNSNKYLNDNHSLKAVSLGDAYHALKSLKAADNKYFFSRYPWLYNEDFLYAWDELSKYRNRMAHIGEIIDADILRENYKAFQDFLRFMPNITKAKRELAPRGYKQPLKYVKESDRSVRVIGAHGCYKKSNRPTSSSREREELCETDSLFEKYIYNIQNKAKVFKKRNGGRGLKDSKNNILVPPNYDDFVFLPKLSDVYQRKSVIAIRDEKYIVVALDGSGKELTTENYDEIMLANKRLIYSPYIFRKKGRRRWGCMDEWGKEMCDTIIDYYVCSEKSLTYESNELRGYWRFGDPDSPFLPPIFDDIEMMDSLEEPLLFIRNGIDGYVKIVGDGFEFIPRAELEKLNEEDRRNTLKCCISEG